MLHTQIIADELDEADRALDDAVRHAVTEWVELAQKRQDLQIPPKPRNANQTQMLRERIEELESSIAMYAARGGVGVNEFERLCEAEFGRSRRLPGVRAQKPKLVHVSEEQRLAYEIGRDQALLERLGREREQAAAVVAQRVKQIGEVGRRLAVATKARDQLRAQG